MGFEPGTQVAVDAMSRALDHLGYPRAQVRLSDGAGERVSLVSLTYTLEWDWCCLFICFGGGGSDARGVDGPAGSVFWERLFGD